MRPVDGDDPKSTAAKPGDTTGGAVEGRLTRSRARLQAAAKTGAEGPKRPTAEDVSRGEQKKHKTAAAATTPGGRSLSKEELKLAARPPNPNTGKVKDWIICKDEQGRLYKMPVFRVDLPTITSEVKDPETEKSVNSLEDSDMVMDKSRSVLAISSIDPSDGAVLCQCTGIIYEFDDVVKTAKILTSSLICCKLWHPKLKVIDYLSFGARPNYDQQVFFLGRDKDYHLIVRSGSILGLEQPFAGQNHSLFSRASSPVACTGGPVIDKHGQVTGIMMANRFTGTAIVSISTVMKCIKMWYRFGRIIHPVHDLDLKAVRMLNIYRRDELFIRNNIRSGFIVDQVLRNSTAQKMGIRRGDIIDVMSLELGTTLSEFEDNLLEISWQFLEKELDPILDLQIQVHNLY